VFKVNPGLKYFWPICPEKGQKRQIPQKKKRTKKESF